MEEEVNPRDIGRFDTTANRMEQFENLQLIIGHFLADFATFESLHLTVVLKAISSDPTLVEYLPELMDLYNRLKLLRYLADAHGLPKPLIDDIKAVCDAANALREWRNEIAHGAAVLAGPFLTHPDTFDLIAGVHRPPSKRQVPVHDLFQGNANAGEFRELTELSRKWILSTDTIYSLILPTRELQDAAAQLANKLQHYRHGEPWERDVVKEVKIPKRPKA